MQSEPMVVCRYGWRQVLRLYEDHLEIDGTVYSLNDLIQVRPVYQHIMGIPSAQLELRFKKRSLRLRGIAAVDDARKIASYLNYQLTAMPPTIHEIPAAYLSSPGRAQEEADSASMYPAQAGAELEDVRLSEPIFQEHNPIISDYKVASAPVPPTPTLKLGWEREIPVSPISS
jgi:hypothetical protein